MAAAFKLPPLPSIKEIIRLYKISAKKHLSQNFLLDPKIIDKLVKVAGPLKNAHVCEVGPGPGGITRNILTKEVKHLTVIEKDRRFLPGLEMLNEASGGRLTIYQGDVLRYNMTETFPHEQAAPWMDECPNMQLIGNLPFNVSTPLLSQWLGLVSTQSGPWRCGRVGMTLTFQEEVGERIVANTGHKQRSRLSIMSQYLCHVKVKFLIKGESFVPAPAVNVAVVHLVPRKVPLIEAPYKLVEKLVRHVFHYRQKMCKRGVRTLFPPQRTDLTHRLFAEANVNPEKTPVFLSMSEFARMCVQYKAICDENPDLFNYDYRSQENAPSWRKNVPLLGL